MPKSKKISLEFCIKCQHIRKRSRSVDLENMSTVFGKRFGFIGTLEFIVQPFKLDSFKEIVKKYLKTNCIFCSLFT